MSMVDIRGTEFTDILAEGYISTKVFSKTFLPERFYRPFGSLHDKIFDLIDDDTKQLVAIGAPRGTGKTSLINFSLPAKHILYGKTDFIVPISMSATHAIQQAENLKYELETNELISKVFGPQKSNNWSKEQWVTKGGVMILPRGAGQQVRGILHRNSRPGLILVDDLEDPEHLDSPDQRRKKKEWFFSDVVNSIDRGSKDWRIIVIGTILHEDSLLVNLIDDPDWASVNLPLCDNQYNSYYPEFINTDEVKKLVQSYRNKGLLDVFYREYMGEVISREDASFTQNMFRTYEESDLMLNENPYVESVIIIDPAKTTKMHSAESAIVGVGVDTKKNRLYVRDIVSKKMHPEELYDELFLMVQRIKAKVVGIEVTSLHEWATYPLYNEMIRRKNVNFEVIELHARGSAAIKDTRGSDDKGKVARVRGLVPFYRQGMIFHNAQISSPLERQLLAFPRSRNWDVMDAFSYIVEILERGGRYFEADYNEKDGREAVEEEYKELSAEDKFEGKRKKDFRLYV